MIRLLQQIISGKKGQALPAVLALLVLGGLAIVPSLNYATTVLNSGRIISEGIKGIYAADAGVEEALWCLKNGVTPPGQLSEKVNQLEVAIQTEDKGTHTLYLGELIEPGEHSDYLSVDGEMVWDEEAGTYKYIITVTWQPDSGAPVIHLEEVGARLPVGFSYQPGSAALFVDNLSTNEPEETQDVLGAYLVEWELESPYPSVSEDNPVQTQIFYITGEGSEEGDYAWVVANRDDIGAVGEVTGTAYQITATATRPEDGKVKAKIVAEVIVDAGTTYIVSWQISD
jgi:hypothetical protein